MRYKIEVLEEKLILRKGTIFKEILNKDIRMVKIDFLNNHRAKILLIVLLSSIFGAIFFKVYLGIYEVFFITLLVAYILFLEFGKCVANLTILTNTEKIKFRINSNKIELTLKIIEKLRMKDYLACIEKTNFYKNIA